MGENKYAICNKKRGVRTGGVKVDQDNGRKQPKKYGGHDVENGGVGWQDQKASKRSC